jgi:fatty-acyl-CoA synthase
VALEDTWAFIYTSGTTGRPKGAMRSHGGFALHNLATLANLEFTRQDKSLLVMPMCHANSLFFASAFAYAGASSCVYDAKSFDPEQLLRALAHALATFTSLVPTHYIVLLRLPNAVRAGSNVDSVRKASHIVRTRTQGHQARHSRVVSKLAAPRNVRLDRARVGDSAAP